LVRDSATGVAIHSRPTQDQQHNNPTNAAPIFLFWGQSGVKSHWHRGRHYLDYFHQKNRQEHDTEGVKHLFF
jgi:hypothetical protein